MTVAVPVPACRLVKEDTVVTEAVLEAVLEAVMASRPMLEDVTMIESMLVIVETVLDDMLSALLTGPLVVVVVVI